MKYITKKLTKRKRTLLIICILLLALIIPFFSPLVSKKYTFYSKDLPEEFDGFKIVQITDFHCKDFGDHEEKLISLIKEASPDIIVLTGDIVDEDHTIDNAIDLLEGIYKLCPVYYITGNHEYYDGAPFIEFKEQLKKYGIHYLDNSTEDIEYNGATIKISGLDMNNVANNMIKKVGYADTDYFNILLYHDSEKFNFLACFDYDLILSGHLHGGLIRIPFLGGLLGSDYRFWPTYSYGRYDLLNSTLISSSGLGDARVPRWNNPREIVEITLKAEED